MDRCGLDFDLLLPENSHIRATTVKRTTPATRSRFLRYAGSLEERGLYGGGLELLRGGYGKCIVGRRVEAPKNAPSLGEVYIEWWQRGEGRMLESHCTRMVCRIAMRAANRYGSGGRRPATFRSVRGVDEGSHVRRLQTQGVNGQDEESRCRR